MTGGQTKMPCLQQKIKEYFNQFNGGKLNVKFYDFPDVIMAYGLVNKFVLQESIEQVGEFEICPTAPQIQRTNVPRDLVT